MFLFREYCVEIDEDGHYQLPGLKTLKENIYRPDAVEIGWEKLIVKGKDKASKPIIKNVSGSVPPGTLMAIMGSSGAGKSTLMNVIAGRNLGNLSIEGQILIDGAPAGSSMAKISAYVQQDGII